MGRFDGKGVIVTGGGRGIGQAIARRFAAEGAQVLVVGRTPEPLSETVALIEGDGGQAFALPCDVTRPEDVDAFVRAAVERFGRVDVLVNNAGIDDETQFLEMQEERWRAVVDTNLTAVFLCSQRVAREMVSAGG